MLQVCLANSEVEREEDPELIGKRILESVAILAIRIARIGEEEVTFDVPTV